MTARCTASRADKRRFPKTLLRTLGYYLINSQHLIYDAKQSVKYGLDGVAAINRDVSMKDLLQHFGISNQTLAVADQFLKQALGVALVRMRRSDETYRDVGVDQNHGCVSGTYPFSISASMLSISLTG